VMSETPRSDAVNVAPLTYRPAPGWAAAHGAGEAAGAAAGNAPAEVRAVPVAATDPTPDAQRQASDKRFWDEGLQEGLARRQAEFAGAALQLREGVAGALRDFAHARDAYFHGVEGEVVALALAVVRKILRRESQVDPLLLSGLVRVALEKMAASQTVRMRAHPSQVGAWQEFFAQHGDVLVVPELSGDATLELDRCQLETELGVTDLSLETQLKEIELGLFDLLAQRPAPQGAAPETPASQTPASQTATPQTATPQTPAPADAQKTETR
jgi:flagellar biosynthesis/type III secretory pathway protein FliH